MIKFKSTQKNLTVLVQLRQHGRPVNKYIHFNEKGELSFEHQEGIQGKIIQKLRAQIGKNTIKGLKEMGGKTK